jgi:ABC-type Fe3+/spermidine/putrescine transport system ATPase subunit
MVFQNYALWPHMSVSDNIAFGLIERRVPRAQIADRVRQTLDRVGLTGLGERMPGQLSGGQQQRVVLARALVLNPDVMLLDEPLSNLDAKLRAEMREEIERLHRETDISFVYVTHDQTEALSLADRLVVMHDGRIRAAGRPAELYHRPPNRFCADFLGEANLVEGRAAGMEANMAQVDTQHGSWRALYPGGNPLTAGQSVTCVVRPENLRPAGSSPTANLLSATMLSSRLNGATMTAVLDANGVTMKATLLSKYATGLTGGTAAEWEVDPENTIVVTED